MLPPRLAGLNEAASALFAELSAEAAAEVASDDEAEVWPLSPFAPQAVREMALIAARAVILARRFVTAHPFRVISWSRRCGPWYRDDARV